MEMVELMYDRTVSYSMTLEGAEIGKLAKHLEITRSKLIRLIEDGDLLSQYGAEVCGWIDDNRSDEEVVDELTLETFEAVVSR